jgi:hypothetical protein
VVHESNSRRVGDVQKFVLAPHMATLIVLA